MPEAEGKKAMCSTFKYELKAINRNDDNCHILLGKMTFNLFYHYMSIKIVRTQVCIYLPPDMEAIWNQSRGGKEVNEF